MLNVYLRLQAYAYCGCYYYLPEDLYSCANVELKVWPKQSAATVNHTTILSSIALPTEPTSVPTPSIDASVSLTLTPEPPITVGGSNLATATVTYTGVTAVTSSAGPSASCTSYESNYTTTYTTAEQICVGCPPMQYWPTNATNGAESTPVVTSPITPVPLSTSGWQSTSTMVATGSGTVTTILSCEGGCTGGAPGGATGGSVQTLCVPKRKRRLVLGGVE